MTGTNQIDRREDAERLRRIARRMSYDGPDAETKHILTEIAMRLDAGLYHADKHGTDYVREIVRELEEPVNIEKAMLAGRQARVGLDKGVGPTAAVFLVNVQIAPWQDSPQYAEGFARGFNLAAKWMQGALRDEPPMFPENEVHKAIKPLLSKPDQGRVMGALRTVIRMYDPRSAILHRPLTPEESARLGEMIRNAAPQKVQVADIPPLPAPAKRKFSDPRCTDGYFTAEQMRDYARQALGMAQTPTENEWQACEGIADIPAVHEMLTAFGEDPTGDNGTMVVREIVRALRTPQQALGAPKYDCCANCLRPQGEHQGERCPAPFTTVWHAWDYGFPPKQDHGSGVSDA